jgi:hypothetical protein
MANRQRLEPLRGDFFTARHAVAVFAGLDPFKGRVDLPRRLRMPSVPFCTF